MNGGELFHYTAGDVLKLDQLLRMVLGDFPFFKDAAFSEEQEYRIAAAALTPSTPSPDGPPPPYCFTTKANELIPYVYLFGKENELPISKIIVGPGGNGLRRVHGVGHLLRSIGIDCDVIQSNIPYV